MSCVTELISYANSFALVGRPPKRSLMQIKNNDRPRMEPWRPLALTLANLATKSSSSLVKSLLKVKLKTHAR